MSTKTANLAEVLTRSLEILEPLQGLLPTFHKTIQNLLSETGRERLGIGVVGITSSGKSTFINALLGETLLPEQSKATTNLPVICRKGPRRKVTVAYVEEPKKEHFDEVVTPALLRSLCSEDENPDNAKGIWRVEVELPSCCLHPDLEMIDTPGTDAYGFASHEKITLYRCLPIADIVVFMTQLRRPIAKSDTQLLEKVIENDQRVLFVISHSDREEDDHQDGIVIRSRKTKLQSHVRNLAKQLEGSDLRECGIFAVSSYLAKQAGGDRASDAWRDSNFEAVFSSLDGYANDLGEQLAASRLEPILFT